MITNVTEYLNETVKKYPGKIGFIDEERELTFSEFQTEAKRVAMLIPKEIKNEPIVVFLKKGIRELAAFMGIVYSGNYYVPIDPDSPLERIVNILHVVKTNVIITDQNFGEKLVDIDKNISIIQYESQTGAAIDEQYLVQAVGKRLDTDPVYVLFTSGSTGIPKGVIISHKSVIDYIEWLVKTFDFSEETIFGNQAPFFFDNSILDIYTTQKTGATMCIIPEKLFVFPHKLLDYMDEKKVNTIFWVPSALVAVANAGVLEKHSLPALKKVLFCGEVMPNKQLNAWRKYLPAALYANLYGPTEITDVCSYYIVDRAFADEEILPIGKACGNTELLVLNENNQLCNTDEVGELCVRGTCLSLGYFGNPDKTECAFVQNPLQDKWRELIYRTGDLVKYNERGELLYLCRKDFQIKHMGHRIELGEIETAAYALKGMEQCCALYHDQKKQIVLFSVLSDKLVSEKDIYVWLKTKIPKYMLPSNIIIKEKLELNDNGKIDRVRLRQELLGDAE